MCRAEDSPVCICEMGRTSNNNRNCCTLGVRAHKIAYSCDSAIGWYVWKGTRLPYGSKVHVKTRTVNVEE